MSAPARELFANNAVTTLDGGIDASQTSIDVVDGSLFPATGNFRLVIDSEIIIVTARVTNTLTVVRAQEGTTGASHSSGAVVTLALTAGGFEQWAKDNIPLWGYGRPVGKLVADDGITPLAVADFTWQNQGSTAAADQNGTILMTGAVEASSSTQLRILERTAPSTPYAYIMGFNACIPRGNTTDSCLLCGGFRESATSETTFFGIGPTSDEPYRLRVQRSTNHSTLVAVTAPTDKVQVPLAIISETLWFKIEDDGTDLNWYVGADSENWILFHTVGRTVHMAGGPDRVWWGLINANNESNGMLVRLVHWSRE